MGVNNVTLKVEKVLTRNRIFAGLKIHSWMVICKLPDDQKTTSINMKKRCRVQCVCGQRESIPTYYLTRSNPKKHCGCLNKGLPTLHPLEYNSWYMMNVRCQDPKHVAYKDYGGRGITVCPEWLKSNPHGFSNFLKDMGPRVSKAMSLDRFPDVDGGYNPSNCRWATAEQQANNKRVR